MIPYIDLCPDQQDIHADIDPKTEQDQCSQAAVNVGIVGKVVDINRIEK